MKRDRITYCAVRRREFFARSLKLKVSASIGALLLGSGGAWGACAVPQPGALTVAAATECSEVGGDREGVTVAGKYEGVDVAIKTTGVSDFGVSVGAGGRVDLSGGTLETTGFQSFGIEMRTAGNASLSAKNYSVTTIGADADAITLDGAGLFVELVGVQLTTNASNASGIEAFGGSSVEGSEVTIDINVPVAGGYSDAIWINGGSSVTLRNLKINVDGPTSSGVAVWNGVFDGQDVNISASSDYLSGGLGEQPAGVYSFSANSRAVISRGTISTSGDENHGLFADGGVIQLADVNLVASGASSAAIYISNPISADRGSVEITRGSLSSIQAPLLLAEGALGAVVLNGPMGLSAPMLGGRQILARVTEIPGTLSDLDLTLNNVTTAVGDIDVTGGAGNVLNAEFVNSAWVGDLRVDAGDTGNVTLRGSRWTGWAQNAGTILLNPSVWTVTGDSNAVSVDNSGLITFDPAAAGFPTLTAGSYVGNDGRLGLNTQLDGDGSPSNLLIINGGTATGTTGLIITNAGGVGAQTVSDGILVIDATTLGGTTDANAFSLAQRAAAGAYEYLLFRGGLGGANPEDWFLRSHLVQAAAPDVALYRPEVPLYMPIPAFARHMGLAFLGTLHERVGEQMNIRPQPDQDDYSNGAWVRLIGEGGDASWQGAMNVRASRSSLVGLQAGMDIYRAEHDNGHRDHLGLYAGFAHQTARIRGDALAQRDIGVGKLKLSGPAVGAYWTHYTPAGGYLDGVVQVNWFSAAGISDYATRMDTTGIGISASLEAGHPFALSERWQIEPQAQLIYQSVSVKTGKDDFSSVSFDEGDAVTGRLGLRLQYSSTDGEKVWQPYAKANLWHGFRGTDTTSLGANSFDNEFGDTALELGVGFTAKMNQTASLYGHVDHRWSLDGREKRAVTQGALGLRVNW